jgi:hypothetical protein
MLYGWKYKNEIYKEQDCTNKGMSKMQRTSIHITVIHSQKLKNIVGQGSASPYQIWTSIGECLGEMGNIMDPTRNIASNDDDLNSISTDRDSWLNRCKARLGFKQT